jgi:hypothetical protein
MRFRTLCAAVVGLAAAGCGFLLPGPLRAAESANEIKPPFNLSWGETADRLERLVGAAGGKVTGRRMVRGNREAIEVEGLLQEGLRKTIFYFKQGILTGVELQYQSDAWTEENYNTRMSDLRRRISERYGEGTQTVRKTERVGINGVTQTVAGYRWTVNSTSMQLVYFSAADPKNVYRTLSVHYAAF